MKFITFLAGFFTLASAAVNPFTLTSRSDPAFPHVVNDTSNQYLPFVLSLQSQEDDPNIFRNLQIRPDPTTPGAFLVVVDASSPVLALALRNSTLYSQTRNRPMDKGQVGGLRNSTTYNTSPSQNVREFVFRNITGASSSFLETYNKWTLFGGLSTPSYILENSISPSSEEHIFLACERGTTQDPYYQILYVTFPSGGGSNVPGCRPVVNFEALLMPDINQICGQYCTA